MNGDAYGCEAPQFMDFTNLNEPEDKASIEAFFERRNNENVMTCIEDIQHEVIDEYESEEEQDEDGAMAFYTPMHNGELLKTEGRLSISMVCLSKMHHYEDDKESELSNISDSVKSINLNDNNGQNDNAENEPKRPASARGRAVKITPRLNKSASLRARSNSGTRLNVLAKPKEIQSKYISMLEAVNKFERTTPSRFHSKPKGTVCSTEKLNGPIACTIPYSPALATKIRSRPTTVISSVDLEFKQFEEAKKFKIKANPINRKVLGPIKPLQPIRKSPTLLQPFNITEVQKKVPPPVTSDVREFHARPAPHQPAPLKAVEQLKRKPTCPVTPNVMKHPTRKVQPPVSVEKPPQLCQERKCAPTVMQPFSFEKRDLIKLARREKLREQMLEEERKLREFHSKPMPTKIYKEPSLPVKLNKKAESIENLKTTNKHEEVVKPFKARPPISIMKEPFIPKKSDRPLIEISEFELNTEKRMREREEYNERVKEKERHLEYELYLREEAKRLQEMEEIKIQRQQRVHIAKPIAKFKDLPAIDPRPVTVPKTPMITARYNKNKENLAQPLGDSYEE